jgi:hypothetical protein
MSEWQPMSSAPKDGTRILLWAECTPGGIRSRHVFTATAHRRKGGRWIWFDERDTSLCAYEDTPAGWMPLPAPPQEPRDE